MGFFSRSAKKKPQPGLQELSSPDGKPLTKAERILGTTGLSLITGAQPVQPVLTSASNQPWNADSYPLPERPIPETRRDSGESTVTTFDQFVRAASKPSYQVRSPTSTYSRHPSSIAEGYEEKETASIIASTVTTHRQLIGRESDSTLRSGYNSRLSPFSGSQTFSDFSPREQQWGEDGRFTKPEVYIPQSPAPPVLSRESVESSRRRTGRSDASADFSRLEPVQRPSTAQHSRPLSPSGVSHGGLHPGVVRKSTSQRDLSVHSGLSIYDAETGSFRPYTGMSNQMKPRTTLFLSKQQEEFNKVKEHIRRPPPGTRNWFDSFPELDEDSESASEDEVTEVQIEEPAVNYAELEATVSSKASEPLVTPSEELTEEAVVPISPVSRSTSFHSSLHDIVEGAEVHNSVDPMPPIPSAFSTSTIANPMELPDNNGRVSVISALTRQSTFADRSDYMPSARQSEYAPSNRSSLPFARARDSLASYDNDDQEDTESVEVRSQMSAAPTSHSTKRMSRTGSVKSTRTTHSLPAFRSPPASPAYLTIPPQYTRKTPVKERAASTRSRANTQGTISGASRSSKSSDSGESIHAPAATHKMIAVTEEEAAFLELMRRKKKALAKHGVSTPLQPKYSSSVRRPKTSSGAATGGAEIRQQWATVRSMSVKSARVKSTTSSSLLDRFPASPTTMRRTTLPLSSYALPSPPPSAALPAIPPVPPLPMTHSIAQHTPRTPTLFARRSIGRPTMSAPKTITPSIDSTLSLPKRKLNTISVPTSASTPRLSPLTLDTTRLTRPTQSLPDPLILRSPDSPLSSSPPTPRSRHISGEIMIKEASSTRDSDSTAVADEDEEIEGPFEAVEVPIVIKPMQRLSDVLLSPAATSAHTSPEILARSPISPLSPSWQRKSLVAPMYRKSYAPSPMYRESFTSEASECPDDFADAMSTQASEHSGTPPRKVRSTSLRTVITRPRSSESLSAATPRPAMSQLNFRSPSEGLLTPVPMVNRRRRPGGLSIDVTRANTNDSRRHSISDTSRQSIASLQSLRSSLRHSQALITPAFIVEDIAEQVHIRPGFLRQPVESPKLGPAGSPDLEPVESSNAEPMQQPVEQSVTPSNIPAIEPPVRRAKDSLLRPLLLPQLGRYGGYGPRGSHISVNADVMAAWGELGGWKAVEKIA